MQLLQELFTFVEILSRLIDFMVKLQSQVKLVGKAYGTFKKIVFFVMLKDKFFKRFKMFNNEIHTISTVWIEQCLPY